MYGFIGSIHSAIISANELSSGDYFYIIPSSMIIIWVVFNEIRKLSKKDK